MPSITFKKECVNVRFHNPLRNFEEENYTLEIRTDPLTGQTSIYNPNLRDKAKAFFGDNDPELLKKLVEESEKTCIFCGDKPETGSPMYPKELLPEGRIKKGEAVLFANLFPLAKYHPVVSLCRSHFLKLSEFTPEILVNGFMAAQSFLKVVYGSDPETAYASVNANYLFPAGASLVHPHIQMLAGPTAYSLHARIIEASERYMAENNSCFFDDLRETEKNNAERYIAATGKWHWMAAFSPSGTNEMIAVHEEASDLGLLADRDINDLAGGISNMLKFYESLGHLSFNYSLYSVKDGKRQGSRCLFRIITRQNLYPNYRNDDYFLQKMLNAELIIISPEELAQSARKYF